MATRMTKFEISIEKLSIKFEGSQEVGHEIQRGVRQTLTTLTDMQARAMNAPKLIEETEDTITKVVPAETNANGKGTEPPKPAKTRRKGTGPSALSGLRDLLKSGYFSERRTAADATERSKIAGSNHTHSRVASELQRLVIAKEIHRTKNGDGIYVYKDTPFDESPGNPGTAGDATE